MLEKWHSSESMAVCRLNTRIKLSRWQFLPEPQSGSRNFKFLSRDRLRERRVFGCLITVNTVNSYRGFRENCGQFVASFSKAENCGSTIQL